MSRPRKSEQRTEQVNLRLTKQEAETLQQAAKELGVIPSTLARQALFSGLKTLKRSSKKEQIA